MSGMKVGTSEALSHNNYTNKCSLSKLDVRQGDQGHWRSQFFAGA